MALDPQLLEAYRSARYEVEAGEPLGFRIGEPSAALDALLAGAGAAHGAFITAANPHSVPHSAEDNAAALERLRGDVAPWRHFPAKSCDDSGAWTERSLLVAGIERAQAERLGRKYGQNAIVYLERGRAPQLVVLA